MNHPMRRAALALHALDGKDQSWLLERLPQAQSGVLKSLLSELQTLGIPADVLPGVEGANDPNLGHTAASAASMDEIEIDLAAAALWAAHEADWVVAQVLIAMPATRRGELLKALDVDRKQRLEKLMGDIRPLKGALKARLLTNAYAAIRAIDPPPVGVVSRRFKKGAWQWLQSFARRG